MFRPSPQQERERISLQAASWLQDMQGQPSGESRAAFAEWLAASPAHVREFLLLSMLDSHLSSNLDVERAIDVDALIADAGQGAQVLPLRPADVPHAVGRPNAPAEPTPQSPRTVTAVRRPGHTAWLGWMSGVLGVGLVVAAFSGPGLWDQASGQGAALQYATSRGQQRTLVLADGSTLQLGADSRVSVRFSAQQRELVLDAGEAVFKVAHDSSRPFLVHAGRTTVRAVGTQFEVNRLPTGTAVAVIEGKVAVSSRPLPLLERLDETFKPRPRVVVDAKTYRTPLQDQPAALVAGEQAKVAADGQALQRAVLDPLRVDRLQHGRLVFHDSTLIDIAAEFNRYNDGQMVIEGEDLLARRYSGVFDATDPESFAQFLALDHGLQVLRSGGGYVIRRRSV